MIRRTTLILVSLFCIFFFEKITFAKSTGETPVNYDQLVPIAKKFIGVPYAWGGTQPSGFDCSGYVTYVFDQLNMKLPRISRDMAKVGSSVKRADLRVGDLVFFNTYGNDISHVGIYIGNNEFIHSQDGKGVSINLLNDPFYWGKKYVGATRVLDYELDAGSFQDIKKSHWAFEAVSKLGRAELVVGYEDSYFLPEEKMTRADMAALLAVALELNLANRKQVFKDVPSGHWAVGAVNALVKEGIVAAEGPFRPDAVVKREDVALMFDKAFKLKANAASVREVSLSDVSASDPSYGAIRRLVASGVAVPGGDGSFKPREEVTRAQYATFLYRVLFEM
ncbi:C40 family peptidase [Pseudoneobacillus sp. C159]